MSICGVCGSADHMDYGYCVKCQKTTLTFKGRRTTESWWTGLKWWERFLLCPIYMIMIGYLCLKGEQIEIIKKID